MHMIDESLIMPLEIVVDSTMDNGEAEQMVGRYAVLAGLVLIAACVLPCFVLAGVTSKYSASRRRRSTKRRWSSFRSSQKLSMSLVESVRFAALQAQSSFLAEAFELQGMAGAGGDLDEEGLGGAGGTLGEKGGVSSSGGVAGNGSVAVGGAGGQTFFIRCSCSSIDFQEEMYVGKFSCKDSWRAVLKAGVSSCSDKDLVLVKRVRSTKQPRHLACLKTELMALKKIKPHPHFLNLLGCVLNEDEVCGIITEFTPHGTLYSFLLAKKKASVGRWSSIEEEETDGGWKVDTLSKQRALLASCSAIQDVALLHSQAVRERPFVAPLSEELQEVDELVFAVQISSAMEHLSSLNVLHNTLCTEYVYISADLYLKLAEPDHSLPFLHHTSTLPRLKRAPSGRNLFKWDAPEVMNTHTFSEKSEVWRFGLTLWELHTHGDTPFRDISNHTLPNAIRSGIRPLTLGDNQHERICDLIKQCLEWSPEDRPTFSTLTEATKEALTAVAREKDLVADAHAHTPQAVENPDDKNSRQTVTETDDTLMFSQQEHSHSADRSLGFEGLLLPKSTSCDSSSPTHSLPGGSASVASSASPQRDSDRSITTTQTGNRRSIVASQTNNERSIVASQTDNDRIHMTPQTKIDRSLFVTSQTNNETITFSNSQNNCDGSIIATSNSQASNHDRRSLNLMTSQNDSERSRSVMADLNSKGCVIETSASQCKSGFVNGRDSNSNAHSSAHMRRWKFRQMRGRIATALPHSKKHSPLISQSSEGGSSSCSSSLSPTCSSASPLLSHTPLLPGPSSHTLNNTNNRVRPLQLYSSSVVTAIAIDLSDARRQDNATDVSVCGRGAEIGRLHDHKTDSQDLNVSFDSVTSASALVDDGSVVKDTAGNESNTSASETFTPTFLQCRQTVV